MKPEVSFAFDSLSFLLTRLAVVLGFEPGLGISFYV